MNTVNDPRQGNAAIGQWKVIYMGGIPGYYGYLGKTWLTLFRDGFQLMSDKLGTHSFSYSDVISWEIVKERSSYATANANAFFKPRHIRIEYVDANRQRNTLLLEMIQSILLPQNARYCRDMMLLMQQWKIFEQFRSAAPDSNSANASILSLLENLGELHKAGVLSDKEFEEKKAELMARL